MSADPYAWWRDAMAGLKPPVHSTPEAGFFLRYIGMEGNERQYLPASVYWAGTVDPETGECLEDQELHCDVGGVPVDPTDVWLALAKRPISQSEYEQRLAALFRDTTEVT